MPLPHISRRLFLKATCASATSMSVASMAPADDRPKVVQPRTTDGDRVHEPKWEEQLTITVGPKSADLVGTSDRVIQAAVDYVARLGGGTVHLLPGTYHW